MATHLASSVFCTEDVRAGRSPFLRTLADLRDQSWSLRRLEVPLALMLLSLLDAPEVPIPPHGSTNIKHAYSIAFSLAHHVLFAIRSLVHFPLLGIRSIIDHLARGGLHLSETSIRRFFEAPASKAASPYGPRFRGKGPRKAERNCNR
jgi:hypothetical protein